MSEYTNEQLTEIIQELWYVISEGYTYDQALLHMKAHERGKSTRKRTIVEEVEIVEADDV
tara:strand:- start:1470 stop:1649 length:180 start_codon:yes stop_codon:yes gene_type:complete